MAKTADHACYYCGATADDHDDHIPPKILFRGHLRDYQAPPVLTVPSCRAHNRGMSADDEAFALMVTAGAGGNAQTDVFMRLNLNLGEKCHVEREQTAAKLALQGTRILDRRDDYDEDGRPLVRLPTRESLEEGREVVPQQRLRFERVARRISAGLHFRATDPQVILGVAAVEGLRLHLPDAKDTGDRFPFGPVEILEEAFFQPCFGGWARPPWRAIASGSPEVFRCDHAWSSRRPRQFALRMTFFETFRLWVTAAC